MPSKNLTVQEHSCKMAWAMFSLLTSSPSPAPELGQGNGLFSQTTNIHSYCALFLRQHGGPSERFFFFLLLNPVAGVWDCCQYLQQHWHVFPLRAAWLKATCYTLSLTHTHRVTNTHTDLHKSCCDYTSKPSDRNLVWAAVKPDRSSNPFID